MPKQPRPHADLIKQWADGAEIQGRKPGTEEWKDYADPAFVSNWEYRVKPEREYPKLTPGTVAQMADYFCLQVGTIELVSQRTLREAIDNGQVVTREEFDKVSSELKSAELAFYLIYGKKYRPGMVVEVKA